MVDTPFLSWAGLKATGTTAGASLPDRLASVANVKDFGATGNSSTDDTAAIQACFDAAFGSWASPHGQPNYLNNKPVYFPSGRYKVTSPGGTTITGCTSGTSGWCLLNVASTALFATGDMAYCRGVNGVPNANGSFGIDVISAGTPGTILLRNATFSGSYVSGGTLTQPCLRVRQTNAGLICGDVTSGVFTSSPNCAVLTLNGFAGAIRDLGFDGGDVAGTIGLDYNWCQRVGDTVSAQSSGFSNLFCAGADYGLAIGMGQAMCSETTIDKCFFSGRTGVIVANQNALSQNIKGGNISGCKDYGIYVSGGSCPVIQGVGFQAYPNAVLAFFGYIVGTTLTVVSMTQVRHPGVGLEVGDRITSEVAGITALTTIAAFGTGTGGAGTYTLNNSMTFASSGSPQVIGVSGKADIYMPNGQNDAILIQGCRSESANFAWLPYQQPYSLVGNALLSGDADGFFYHGAGKTTISACLALAGWINPSSGSLSVDAACTFLATDYWRHNDGADPNNPTYLHIDPKPIIIDASNARSTIGMDGNCLIRFTSSSAIVVTVTKTDATTGTRMAVGSCIEYEQDGTGQITFTPASGVTLRAPTIQGTVTSRARGSTVKLTVLATNLWSVSDGGITP